MIESGREIGTAHAFLRFTRNERRGDEKKNRQSHERGAFAEPHRDSSEPVDALKEEERGGTVEQPTDKI